MPVAADFQTVTPSLFAWQAFDPAVKCETASSGIASFLEAYRDMIWGLRWLLSPAILVTLSLVISITFALSSIMVPAATIFPPSRAVTRPSQWDMPASCQGGAAGDLSLDVGTNVAELLTSRTE